MHVPASTYRIQLNSEFTFRHLKDILEYLHQLGISTIYAAPIFQATQGSNHGYDVTDPHRINPEIGTEEELMQIRDWLAAKNMTWLQDIVPNHMAYTTSNERLMDVLERGPSSPYYEYFDINWKHHDERFAGKLMVPFLGEPLANLVDEKQVQVGFLNGSLFIDAAGTQYPASLPVYEFLARYAEKSAVIDVSARKFLFVFAERGTQKVSLSEWSELKNKLISESSIDEASMNILLGIINADKQLLMQLLQEQFYVLEYWKTSDRTISFRRFFTVNSLLCLSMENQEVFDEYHKLILHLYKEGYIHGLRIDHIDGLKHPKQYVERLRDQVGKDCYVIAEKILEASENLPSDWPLQGTSGYEFLAYVSQLLTNVDGAWKLTDFYSELIGTRVSYTEMVFSKKKMILMNSMQGELDNLVELAGTKDLVPAELISSGNFRNALANFMSAFPVYRIYPDMFPLRNLELVDEAYHLALEKEPSLEQELNSIRDLFQSDHVSTVESEDRLSFLRRLMQFTGPLAAKGVEDTTFYIYNPLISHNEVGDSPGKLGIRVEEFHDLMIHRQKHQPLCLNATATHDTKRGEDSRLRINVLTEFADEWIALVKTWQQMNHALKTEVNGKAAPSVNEEYFIYQSVIGGFPENLRAEQSFIDRLKTYMNKVLREAKENTNWSDSNVEYETAVSNFIQQILDEKHGFIESLKAFLTKVIARSSDYSLAQALIKITAPGIPDIYQGCELWDLSYVDPDNRRAVDYEFRKSLLDLAKNELSTGEALQSLKKHEVAGARKLYLTMKSLQFRRNHPELFTQGEYIPLALKEGNGIAYLRSFDGKFVLVAIPLNETVGSTNSMRIELPPDVASGWTNVLTGSEHVLKGDIVLNDIREDWPVIFLSGL